MFTPQEIQERTFEKAVFGGYDMQTVDEFLEPLTEDYITLYRENAVLKSKMKVLVEKLEEYRAQEQSMRKAIISAQRTADAMVAEAEKKCAQLMNNADAAAQLQQTDAQLAQQIERVNNAKKTAKNFIEVLEQDIRGHLELLEKLKNEDLEEEELPAAQAQPVQAARPKPFDFEMEEEIPLVLPKQEPAAPVQEASAAETAAEIANAIEQNITKIMDVEAPNEPEPEPDARMTTDATIKFTNLQFGRNYDPTTTE